nr:3-keto-5-aminohexanoate cleavage protein [Paraburkholderia graminis]
MRRTAERLFDDEHICSVLAAGRHQMRVATQPALMGGSVHVGLEDSLYIERTLGKKQCRPSPRDPAISLRILARGGDAGGSQNDAFATRRRQH